MDSSADCRAQTRYGHALAFKPICNHSYAGMPTLLEKIEADAARETALPHAERLLREERRRKSDRQKVKIARRLRNESTMTLKWIADKLRMGTWTNVSNCLARTKTRR